MKIRKRARKDFTIASLSGEMEAYDAESFEGEILEIIKSRNKKIIVDFEKLEYISSSGLRALLNIRSRLLKEGGRLLLVSLKDKVLEVFRVSKLLDIFEVYENLEEAMKR